MRIVSSAPTRIDLAGGTIDIWPLDLFHPGATTLNAAISLRAHAQLESRRTAGSRSDLIDTDRTSESPSTRPRWTATNDLCLLSLLARHFRAENATVTTRGDSPAGAGIAGSSALTIATCAAMARWQLAHSATRRRSSSSP